MLHATKRLHLSRNYYWDTNFWVGIQYVWAPLLRPCESDEQSIFSWQIMFTSKSKNTHPHLVEMPSRFVCDLFGHICGQYCLPCGQLSFYCFSSYLARKNHHFGLYAQMHCVTYICTQCTYVVYIHLHTLHRHVRTRAHVNMHKRKHLQKLACCSGGSLHCLFNERCISYRSQNVMQINLLLSVFQNVCNNCYNNHPVWLP